MSSEKKLSRVRLSKTKRNNKSKKQPKSNNAKQSSPSLSIPLVPRVAPPVTQVHPVQDKHVLTMLDLPSDVLSTICSFLSVEDHIRSISHVCHQLRQLQNEVEAWPPCLDLSFVSFATTRAKSERKHRFHGFRRFEEMKFHSAIIQGVGHNYNQDSDDDKDGKDDKGTSQIINIISTMPLSHLDISFSRQLSDFTLSYLISSHLTYTLQSLDLSYCENLSNIALKTLTCLKSLTQLNLTNCLRITDEGLKYLQVMKKLEWLNLSYCVGVVGDGLFYLRHLPLHYLNLNSLYHLNDAHLHHLDQLPLVSLHLKKCSQITHHGLIQLPRNTLMSLDMQRCERVDDESMPILHHFTRLTFLDLSATRVTDSGLDHLAGLPLVKLNLGSCIGLHHLVSSLPKTLREITLSYCVNLDNTALCQLGKMKLEFIDVGGCNQITDEGLVMLNHQVLKQLNVAGCRRILGVGLRKHYN